MKVFYCFCVNFFLLIRSQKNTIIINQKPSTLVKKWEDRPNKGEFNQPLYLILKCFELDHLKKIKLILIAKRDLIK